MKKHKTTEHGNFFSCDHDNCNRLRKNNGKTKKTRVLTDRKTEEREMWEMAEQERKFALELERANPRRKALMEKRELERAEGKQGYRMWNNDRGMDREVKSLAKHWTEENDEILFERVKMFAGRVLRRERGWQAIAEPFTETSVAAVTTRAHKVLRMRNTSIFHLFEEEGLKKGAEVEGLMNQATMAKETSTLRRGGPFEKEEKEKVIYVEEVEDKNGNLVEVEVKHDWVKYDDVTQGFLEAAYVGYNMHSTVTLNGDYTVLKPQQAPEGQTMQRKEDTGYMRRVIREESGSMSYARA
ncbi:hypothetical protein TL16_g09214 [Triparma laevis f. inornata]|uniref:Uncharacterized protein n=2 Tax=Triparma laevis TaxID=1534972 RepID=A0A9W7KUE5_9STRA|nr:hypothetical protein TL16_g09214 [Triparma laevis f. inornata]GMI11675.1 hypothetical protein TrLO_g5491 [Triparma laevis f. longispina]